jgi:hypothetical protein
LPLGGKEKKGLVKAPHDFFEKIHQIHFLDIFCKTLISCSFLFAIEI